MVKHFGKEEVRKKYLFHKGRQELASKIDPIIDYQLKGCMEGGF